ncbi:MAG: hypothetical protein ACQEQF_05005 [Bacillota bacterium]
MIPDVNEGDKIKFYDKYKDEDRIGIIKSFSFYQNEIATVHIKTNQKSIVIERENILERI